jgi:hypothetical protein
MSRAELIDYIRKNDEFYRERDLSRHHEDELRKIKEMIETIKSLQQKSASKK